MIFTHFDELISHNRFSINFQTTLDDSSQYFCNNFLANPALQLLDCKLFDEKVLSSVHGTYNRWFSAIEQTFDRVGDYVKIWEKG